MDEREETNAVRKSGPDRPRAVSRVIDEVRSARAGGARLDDQAVIAAHSDLMPELGHELGKLARIEAAWAATDVPAEFTDNDRDGGRLHKIRLTQA